MVRISEEAEKLIRKFQKTEKQKEFQYDFFVDQSKYEKWEDVVIGTEGFGEREFVVKKEDIDAYVECTDEETPVFTDEESAKKTPWGGRIAPPMFITPVIFWVAGTGSGSWIRTPGAINPGQKIEFYEPVREGDVIRIKSKAYDKYIKRGKRYLTYYSEFRNQRDELVAKWWGTLILPFSKGEEEHKIEGARK
ncbi:MAG: MaoC family dehydratase [Candidatus Freyarchaeota archaeon]